MHDKIVIAKLNWSRYYQGENEPETTLSDGDNYERFNFRRTKEGRFYGSIPRNAPTKGGKWLVVFIARDTDHKHYAVGWYENAVFETGNRPDLSEYDRSMREGEKYGMPFTYSVRAEDAYLLPPKIRHRFETPPLDHFGSATYIYARDLTGADADPWRQRFAEFAERVVAGIID